MSLSNNNQSIASLIIALYPMFPAHESDNRNYLQALRHLSILSTESRYLSCKDVDSLSECLVILSSKILFNLNRIRFQLRLF